ALEALQKKLEELELDE
nr:Chain D, Dual specificity mitogen-activated protein kinase kinase 1 [Homo sapiens]